MQFNHAERDSDWESHLTATVRMLPYLVVADHPQYTRCLIQYLYDMRSLPPTFPEVHRRLMKGYFPVKRTHTRFTATCSDQILECTVKKDAKTTAGIIGEQMDERQTEAWISSQRIHRDIEISRRQSVDDDAITNFTEILFETF